MTDPRKTMFGLCKELGIDDDTRRQMIAELTSKQTSKHLTQQDWRIVLDHLYRLSGKSSANEWAWVDTAPADKQPQLRKLIMLAKAAGIKRGGQIVYIEGIAKQAAGLGGTGVAKSLRMCDAQELRVLVQALSVHNARRKKTTPKVAA